MGMLPKIDVGKIVESVVDGAKSILPRFFADKDKQAEFEQALRSELIQSAMKENSKFRDFVLTYEGAAEDMPKEVQIMRAKVRPRVTYAQFAVWWIQILGMLGFTIFGDTSALNYDYLSLALKLNTVLTLLVAGFWFGDRFVDKILDKVLAWLDTKPKKESA